MLVPDRPVIAKRLHVNGKDNSARRMQKNDREANNMQAIPGYSIQLYL